jgi:GDP-4-dehydro-6-deoxy-D-mannose reductase
VSVTADRILVTGAGGFVGRHLMGALAAAYPNSALLAPAFDLCDAKDVEAAVRTAQPDVCIHLAAVSYVAAARQDPDHAWQVNLHGTVRLAGAILQHAPHCQMIFASSADAYGGSFGSHARVDEGVPLAPTNIYAATKAAADLAIGSMVSDGLRLARLRPFNHTGPGQAAHFVVAAFARQIARVVAGLQAPVLEVGNLDTWRDFLDVRDVCAAYVACIGRRDTLPPGAILNLASGTARRIGDILTDLQALAGIDVEIRTHPSRVRESEAHTPCGDATRARTLLDWQPTIPWAQTIADVLHYWQERIAESPED